MGELSELLGDVRRFYSDICAKLSALGIDASGYPLSHLAVRTKTHREYLTMRDAVEKFAQASIENVWNGRPISKILLAKPLKLGNEGYVDLIEVIPPMHQSVYPMGLEHIGFVVGAAFTDFGDVHRETLTGQQFQSQYCQPYFVRFENFTHAKFYRYSLAEVCLKEGRKFDGINHDTWVADDLDAGPYPDFDNG